MVWIRQRKHHLSIDWTHMFSYTGFAVAFYHWFCTLAVNALTTTTTSSSNSNNNNDNDNDHVNDHHRQQHYNHNHGHNNKDMNFYLGIVYGIGITSVIMFYLTYKPIFSPLTIGSINPVIAQLQALFAYVFLAYFNR